MDWELWQQRVVAQAFSGDPIWRVKAFRLAVFALDTAWDDAVRLRRHPVTRSVGEQLYRAVASIGANISEGYSRSSGLDRARFFEYSLGSTREAGVWYHAGRHVLDAKNLAERFESLTGIRRLLLTSIPQERRHTLRPKSTNQRSGD
jgi:four helix bundle protein